MEKCTPVWEKEAFPNGKPPTLQLRRSASTTVPLRFHLADKIAAPPFLADAIPNAAGGEGSHGVVKPDRVIHRYIFNHV